MRFPIRVLFCFSIILLIFHLNKSANSQDNYFSPGNILKFADYLYQEGDYIRAAGEYERYLFYAAEGASRDSIAYRIGICFLKGKDLQKAIYNFEKIIEQKPQSPLKDITAYQIAYCHYLANRYNQSNYFIEHSCADSSQYRIQLDNLTILNYLFQRNWKDSYSNSCLFIKTKRHNNDSTAIALNRLSQEGLGLARKSRYTAGILSTIVPGLGKVYTHRYADGIYSFILVGLCGWQAVEGFNKNGVNSTRGWIYGAFGTILYAGNIYGSVVAVKIYNDKIEDDLLKRINIDISIK
jgi:tetratricopeptide (TPR) repeat protein